MQHLPSIYIVWKTISNSLFSLHQKHCKDNQFSGIASIFLKKLKWQIQNNEICTTTNRAPLFAPLSQIYERRPQCYNS